MMPRRLARLMNEDQDRARAARDARARSWNAGIETIAATPGGDRHRDGEDVVDEQRRARDERRVLAEVLAADDVAAAAARVGEDRLAVRRDDDREQQRDRDADRDERVEAEREARPADRDDEEDLLGGVRGRRDGVGREHRERDRLRDALVLHLGRGQRPTDQDPLHERHAAVALHALRPRHRPVSGPAGGLGVDQCAIQPASRRRSAIRAGPVDVCTITLHARRRRGMRSGRQRARAEPRPTRSLRRGGRQERGRVPPVPPRRLPRRRVVGFGFDRDHLAEAGIERRRGGRRRHERRQLQHPLRPHRPGELRHRPRRRPHQGPPPRRDLPTARDLDRRHDLVDDRPGHAPPAPGRGAAPRVARPERQRLPRRLPDPAALGGQEAHRAQRARRVLAGGDHPLRHRAGQHAERHRPGGRHPALRGRRVGARHACASVSQVGRGPH